VDTSTTTTTTTTTITSTNSSISTPLLPTTIDTTSIKNNSEKNIENEQLSSSEPAIPVCLDCSQCKRTFLNRHSLNQHKKAKHGLFTNSKPEWSQAVKLQKQQQHPLPANNEIVENHQPTVNDKNNENRIITVGDSVIVSDSVDNDSQKSNTTITSGTTEGNAVLSVNSPFTSAFPCAICGILFTDENSLASHYSNGIVPVPVATFPCMKCSRIFASGRALEQHLNYCLTTATTTTIPIPSLVGVTELIMKEE